MLNDNLILFCHYINILIQYRLTLVPIAGTTLFKLLKNIDVTKAAGINKFSGKSLKDGAQILGKPISELRNLSRALKTFPDIYKNPKLNPLSKIGSKIDPPNHRPKSLLPLLSKVFERIVLDQTNDFLSRNKLLYDYKSGSKKDHLIDKRLSFLNEKVAKGFDDGLLTYIILIVDLQKTFDTIKYDILLRNCYYWVLLVYLTIPLIIIYQTKNFL